MFVASAKISSFCNSISLYRKVNKIMNESSPEKSQEFTNHKLIDDTVSKPSIFNDYYCSYFSYGLCVLITVIVFEDLLLLFISAIVTY